MRGERHILARRLLGRAEAEQVEHVDGEPLGEARGDAPPRPRRPRRAVHQHHRRAVAEPVPGDRTAVGRELPAEFHVVHHRWMPPELPAISYDMWSETCDTLHAHTQVLGKLAATLGPPEPQLQHAALRLTARGWETRPLPAPDGSGVFVVALDLHRHEAIAEHSDGRERRVALTPDRAVGSVTRELLDAVRELVGAVEIDPTPQEVPGRRRSTRTTSTRATTPRRSPPTSPPRPGRRSCSRSSARRTAGAPRRSTRGGARSTSR